MKWEKLQHIMYCIWNIVIQRGGGIICDTEVVITGLNKHDTVKSINSKKNKKKCNSGLTERNTADRSDAGPLQGIHISRLEKPTACKYAST